MQHTRFWATKLKATRVNAASESVAGIVQLSTDAETIAGVSTTKATTPSNLVAKMSAPGPIGDNVPNTGTFTELLNSGEYVQRVTLNAASGNEVAHQINYTTNKAAGNDTGLEINMTDTASPGTSYGINYKVGGNTKFNISNSGVLTLIGTQSTTLNDRKLSLLVGYGTIEATLTGMKYDVPNTQPSGDMHSFLQGATTGMTDTDGEQSFQYLAPIVKQSGTAAYNGLKIDVTETTLGDGTTGDGNNLIRAAVGGTTKFKVDNAGSVAAAGDMVLAGNSVIGGNAGISGELVVEGEANFNSNININGYMEAPADSGAIVLFDMPVSSTPVAGTEMSASIRIDATTIIKAYAESDAAGGIKNPAAKITGNISVTGGIFTGLTDSGHANYDPSALTDDFKIVVNPSGEARNVIISTEDVESGTPTLTRDFKIMDWYGYAGKNNITVMLENSGEINGTQYAVLSSNYDVINLHCDGTNARIS